jgi:hypothetical protein
MSRSSFEWLGPKEALIGISEEEHGRRTKGTRRLVWKLLRVDTDELLPKGRSRNMASTFKRVSFLSESG